MEASIRHSCVFEGSEKIIIAFLVRSLIGSGMSIFGKDLLDGISNDLMFWEF